MQLTSRITSITPNGEWSNGQRTFNKYRVTFANGDNLSFLAVGDFKGQVGDNLTYQKNESNQTGKVVRENNYQNQGSYSAPKSSGSKEDTQTYIIRQSMIKAAIDYHGLQPHGHSSEEDIIRTSRKFVTFRNKG